MECKKVKFINQEFADSYVAKLQKTSKRNRKPIRSYLCPKCNVWHITSAEEKDLTSGRFVLWQELVIKGQEKTIIELNNKINYLNEYHKEDRANVVKTYKDMINSMDKKIREKDATISQLKANLLQYKPIK